MTSDTSHLPDIVVILSDQLNPGCLGCAGNPDVRTPNIDRVATEGMQFLCAYSTSPVCMPARCSLATGLYPHNHHFWSNFLDHRLNPQLGTFFQDLRGAGYRTAQIGKFHYHEIDWGDDLERESAYYYRLGIDDALDIPGPYFVPYHQSVYSRYLSDRGELQDYLDDMISRLAGRNEYLVRPSTLAPQNHNDGYVARRAAEYITARSQEQPLCMMVSFPGPHPPMDAPGEYARMYNPEFIELPANTAPVDRVTGQVGLDELRRIRANYYGKITYLDDCIGTVLTALESRGRLDNTLFVLTSDHGECMGAHGRLSKGVFYEESARVPMIMRWPGRIEANTRTSAPAELSDLRATFAEVAGTTPQTHQFGRSLVPVMKDVNSRPRDFAVSEIKHRYMVRTERFKWFRDGTTEHLFDMIRDPSESEDLGAAESHREERIRMRKRLARFLEETQLDYSADYVPRFKRAEAAGAGDNLEDWLTERSFQVHQIES